jgi:hypothetical protein
MAARRQRPHDLEREPGPLGSHSCRPCRVGPPVPLRRRVKGCSGLLVMARSRRGRCATVSRRAPAPEREGGSCVGGMREEQWLIRHACGCKHVRVGVKVRASRVQVQTRVRSTFSSYHYRLINTVPWHQVWPDPIRLCLGHVFL